MKKWIHYYVVFGASVAFSLFCLLQLRQSPLLNTSASSNSQKQSTINDLPKVLHSPKVYPRGYLSQTIRGKRKYDLEYVWANATTLLVRGIVLIVHKCKTPAGSFFNPQSDCPNCIGRPVEKELSRYFSEKGFVSLSINSRTHCLKEDDYGDVIDIIFQIYENLNININTVPLYGLGLSSGVKFLTGLFSRNKDVWKGINNAALCFMNGGIWIDIPNTWRTPTLFIAMSRNHQLCMQNEKTVSALNDRNIDATMLTCDPRPIGPTYFYEIGQVLSLDDSVRLHDSLRSSGDILWPANNILVDDPFSFVGSPRWRNVSYGDVICFCPSYYRALVTATVPCISNRRRR